MSLRVLYIDSVYFTLPDTRKTCQLILEAFYMKPSCIILLKIWFCFYCLNLECDFTAKFFCSEHVKMILNVKFNYVNYNS